MNTQALLRELDAACMKLTVPTVRTGHSVKVTQKVKEGDKERLQIFEGLVIRTHGKGGINSTITVRKISNGIGVEKIFPVHGSNVVDIEIVKIAKIRRSKLYYMRDRFGKSARLKEQQTTQTVRDKLTKTIPEVAAYQAANKKTETPAETITEEAAAE